MYVVDCSMYEDQDFLRTMMGQIAVFEDRQDADNAVKLLGGKVEEFKGQYCPFNHALI